MMLVQRQRLLNLSRIIFERNGNAFRNYLSTPYFRKDEDDDEDVPTPTLNRENESKGAFRDFMRSHSTVQRDNVDTKKSSWMKMIKVMEPDAPPSIERPRSARPSSGSRPTSREDGTDSDSSSDAASSTIKSEAPRYTKHVNSRLGANNRGKRTPTPWMQRDSDGDGGGGGGGRKPGSKRRSEEQLEDGGVLGRFELDDDFAFDSDENESQKEMSDDDGLNELEKQLLFDNDEFEARLMKTPGSVDLSGMDPIDALLADAFFESSKSSDGSYQKMLIHEKRMKDTQLPKARSMKALLNSMKPQISTAEPKTFGHNIAVEVWKELQKNVYIPDKDKYSMCNFIAKLGNELDEFVKENEGKERDELLFQPWFRKGLTGIETEMKMKLGEDYNPDADVDQSEETDWDVEAVADEDELELSQEKKL